MISQRHFKRPQLYQRDGSKLFIYVSFALSFSADTKEAIDKHEQIKAGVVEKIMDDSAWVTEFRELSKTTFLRRSPSLIELMRWFSR